MSQPFSLGWLVCFMVIGWLYQGPGCTADSCFMSPKLKVARWQQLCFRTAGLALLVTRVSSAGIEPDDQKSLELVKKASELASQNYNEAIHQMKRAVQMASPTNVETNFKAAVLYMKAPNFKLGEQSYLAAIKAAESNPTDTNLKYVAMAHNNLCVEYHRGGRYEKAFKHCKLALKKASWPFWHPEKTLGLIHEKWSETDEAKESYLRAHQKKRNDAFLIHAATMLPLAYSSMDDLNDRRERMVSDVDALSRKHLHIEDMLSLVTVPHFYSAFWGHDNVDMYKSIASILISSDPRHRQMGSNENSKSYIAYTAPFVKEQLVFGNTYSNKRHTDRIKVGFSSMFFREHASGKMIQGIISGLNKSKFEVVIFCIKEKYGQPYSGAVADRIRDRADKYIELNKPDGLLTLREKIESERLDVLVYAEIGMDPANYALSFSRLAPVQVVTHGHASTTGVPSLDYFVSYKPFESIDAQRYYSEKLVTFSDFSPYFKPDVPVTVPDKATVFKDLKLNPKTYVFACLQTLFKLTPESDPIFQRILQRVPNSVLVMKRFGSTKVQQRLMNRLQLTMPDVVHRVVMLPGLSSANWYGLLKHADTILDSYPFGGYTTTLEALAVGSVPIVTFPHSQMAGRCTKGILDIMGISDTIASSIDEYIDIAVRLAEDYNFHDGVSKQLQSNSDLLWERQTTIGEWEEFLEEVVTNRSVTNLHTKTPTWKRVRSKKLRQR